MGYEFVEGCAEYAIIRCPTCGMEAKIQAASGPERVSIMKALREVRGCECPIGEGGTAAVIPGMKVWRLSDGKKFQVSDIQPKTQQIKVIGTDDRISGWLDVRRFSKMRPGLSVDQYIDRLKNGLAK